MSISASFQHLNMTQSESYAVYKELYSAEKSVHLHYVCKVPLLTLNGNVNNQNNILVPTS